MLLIDLLLLKDYVHMAHNFASDVYLFCDIQVTCRAQKLALMLHMPFQE